MMHAIFKAGQNRERIVFHSATLISVIFGVFLIALGILGLPPMIFFMGRVAALLGMLSSAGLVLAGVAWLVGVGVFVRFFGSYLSRN